MKLEVGGCACAKNLRVYCRTSKGYRFSGERCKVVGRLPDHIVKGEGK